MIFSTGSFNSFSCLSDHTGNKKAPKSTTWVERLVHLGGQLMADPRHGFDVPVRSPRFGIAPRVALLRFEITRKSGTKALRTHEHTLQLLGALKSAKTPGNPVPSQLHSRSTPPRVELVHRHGRDQRFDAEHAWNSVVHQRMLLHMAGRFDTSPYQVVGPMCDTL